LDGKLGNIISKSMGRMTSCRRNLLYEPMELGGLGMVRLQDQYWINRARVMVQLIKAGGRLEIEGKILIGHGAIILKYVRLANSILSFLGLMPVGRICHVGSNS